MNIKIVKEDYFRSQPFVNMDYDMVRAAIIVPKIEWIKFKNELKQTQQLEEQYKRERDIKQFECPECGTLMNQNELNRTWDWAGPHCNNCGCTGMVMFGTVQDHAPVISGG